MKITNNLNSDQSFKGITFLYNFPEKLANEIKTNSIIKKAGRKYSLSFSIHSILGKDKVICTMSKPNTDSILSLMLTPQHIITTKQHIFDPNDFSKLRETPDFFEKKLGTKNFSLWDRIVAIGEAFRIAFLTQKDAKSGKASAVIKKINRKYQ